MLESYVLVVDDEHLVRESLVRWLRSLGYESIAVDNADDAIECIARQVPAAVIADMMMPVHDGVWLIEQIRVRWPSLPVIMASGASFDERALSSLRRLGADIITKPFGREMLSEALLRAHKVSD